MAVPVIAKPIATHVAKRAIRAIVTPSMFIFRDCKRVLAASALLSAATLLAQAPPPPQQPPADLYTLHVYANLAQVPTLVINPDGNPIPPLTRDKFNISLDGG